MAPDPISQSDVLDPATVAELRKAQIEYGNPEFIRQLVEIYRANAPKRIEQIRTSIAARDARTLTLVAHTLKSNCAMLGAVAMAQWCARLESCGENSTFDAADAFLAEVDTEFVRVLSALAHLLDATRRSRG